MLPAQDPEQAARPHFRTLRRGKWGLFPVSPSALRASYDDLAQVDSFPFDVAGLGMGRGKGSCQGTPLPM